MEKRRLAMTSDGRLTYCSAKEENIGKGKCNHIGHQKENESASTFTERVTFEKDVNDILNILGEYDDHKINSSTIEHKKESYHLNYKDCAQYILNLSIFPGNIVEREFNKGGYESDINNIYQTFDGQELYPTVEDKAAILLYSIIKNHNFDNYNKRIATATFLFYLKKNKILAKDSITDKKWAPLTLLIAKSGSEEKDEIINLIKAMI